ncbi:MAG TPA: hypothetical protein VNT52_04860, partial [Acidimicrobiales bacterium]|nr:hypothetical protein [Acidimicrobiales bacterium]
MRLSPAVQQRHDHDGTKLRCASCAEPICPQCLVKTEAGLKCQRCATPDYRRQPRSALPRPAPVSLALAISLLLGMGVLAAADVRTNAPDKPESERDSVGGPVNVPTVDDPRTGFPP